MRVVFDTNAVLDVLLDRAPHVDVAAKLFALAPVDRGVLDRALDLELEGFEDAVLHEAAPSAGAAAGPAMRLLVCRQPLSFSRVYNQYKQ